MGMNAVLVVLKTLMDAKGYSEYKLAQKSSVAQSTINSFFNKNNIPSIPTLILLCEGLDLDLVEFFTYYNFYNELIEQDVNYEWTHHDLKIAEEASSIPQFKNKGLEMKVGLLNHDQRVVIEALVDQFLKLEFDEKS